MPKVQRRGSLGWRHTESGRFVGQSALLAALLAAFLRHLSGGRPSERVESAGRRRPPRARVHLLGGQHWAIA